MAVQNKQHIVGKKMNTQEVIEILERETPNYADFDTVGDYDVAVLQYRRALTHAIEVMKRGQWQTMESAPRDGVECLYWDRRYETVLIAKRGMSDMPQTGDWEYELDATHWMPLPDAPESEETK